LRIRRSADFVFGINDFLLRKRAVNLANDTEMSTSKNRNGVSILSGSPLPKSSVLYIFAAGCSFMTIRTGGVGIADFYEILT
jgi:hypothetical protein